MKKAEYAKSKGITVDKLRDEQVSFAMSEGYDGAGNEYGTLDAWIDRKQPKQIVDPFDGGRGAGQMGYEPEF